MALGRVSSTCSLRGRDGSSMSCVAVFPLKCRFGWYGRSAVESRRLVSIPPPERTMWRIPGLSVLHLLLPLGSVAAQLCAGVQSFAGRPVQLWGFGTFTSGSHLGSYGGGVRLIGGRAAFGDVELGASHTDAYGGHSWLVGTGAAYQVSLNKSGTVQLCPEASVGFVLGPKNIDGSGQDFSETDAAPEPASVYSQVIRRRSMSYRPPRLSSSIAIRNSRTT